MLTKNFTKPALNYLTISWQPLSKPLSRPLSKPSWKPFRSRKPHTACTVTISRSASIYQPRNNTN